jgi:co-chaperonin GroES (HSP10)|uniref:Co-chaperonin GroES n=1 Tax=uncultured virus TaxID=340016 RepID=A0A221S3D7_9VIRU|nr:co-chaperonin GroES [uncultured virus]
MTTKPEAGNAADIAWAFPSVDPGAKPLGGRVLVQLRRTKKTVTSAGIILVEETKETEKWNNMVARVVENGPLAFKKRDSMEPWPEGSWCEPGDFIRVPKWGGDRWEVEVGDDEEKALFMILNDHEIIARVTGDPLLMRAFV